MRISELLAREPFGDTLQSTLADYFSIRFGQLYQVIWHPGRPSLVVVQSNLERYWLCNYYLNAIFSPLAAPEIFEPMKREYSQSLSKWKAPLQKAYVELACRPRSTGRLLAHAIVEITPALPNANSLVIMGGNHKIRIVDYNNQTVYGILKRGFNSAFIKNEIRVRRLALADGLPTPQFKQIGANDGWFSEEYIVGTPINRLSDSTLITHVLSIASEAVQTLSTHYLQQVSVGDYSAKLAADIRESVTSPHLQQFREAVSNLMQAILQSIQSIFSHQATIFTSLTHGDFQPANILLDDVGKVWLIDWEYADHRIAYYDLLTYCLGTRRGANGLATRIAYFIKHGFHTPGLQLAPWAQRGCSTPKDRQLHILIFILEEVLHTLSEIDNPNFTKSFFDQHPIIGLITECQQVVSATLDC